MGTAKQNRLTRAEKRTELERKQKYERKLQDALKASKTRKPTIQVIIDKLRCDQNVEWYKYPHDYSEIQSFFNIYKKRSRHAERKAYLDLLEHLSQQNCDALVSNDKYLAALGEIALLHNEFLEDPRSWKRKHRNPEKQFKSFVRHCFAKYFVPAVLDDCWFDSNKTQERAWFLWVGKGSNIRKAKSMPIELSKKMAHQFLQAPTFYNASEALRWAQVRGLGGDGKLAAEIVKSNLGRNGFVNEGFWKTVVEYFVAQNYTGFLGFNGILDYLSFCHQMDPNYKIYGRSLQALLRNAFSWLDDVRKMKIKAGKSAWPRSGINEFATTLEVEDNVREFYIVELRSADELLDEGRRMRNCVGSYAYRCRDKSCAIFSLRELVGNNERRLATIEVILSTRIVTQQLGKCNNPLSEIHDEIIRRWTTAECLN